MKKEGNSKTRECLIIAIIAVAIVLVAFLIFVILGGKEKVAKDSFNDAVFSAIEKKDVSECERLQSENLIIYCEIEANARIKNTVFCNTDFKNNLTFPVVLMRNEKRYSLDLGARDFCWLSMAEKVNATLCGNMANLNDKTACEEYTRI